MSYVLVSRHIDDGYPQEKSDWSYEGTYDTYSEADEAWSDKSDHYRKQHWHEIFSEDEWYA